MCKTSQEKQNDVDIEMQCDMLFILSALCDGDMHRKVTKEIIRITFYEHPLYISNWLIFSKLFNRNCSAVLG